MVMVIRRLVRSLDFERVLRTRSRASSPHFAVHHSVDGPMAPNSRAGNGNTPLPGELSTVPAHDLEPAVDRSAHPSSSGVWLGAVVPKRHARRAVTRTLLKRQIRNVVSERGDGLDHGVWVVRLRAPFDRTLFTSAASDALKRQARAELDQLLVAAMARLPRR